MTDKPSEWAMGVWAEAFEEWALQLDKEVATKAAALVIDQARKAWEAEICEWITNGFDPAEELEYPLKSLRYAIERGEYRKSKL